MKRRWGTPRSLALGAAVLVVGSSFALDARAQSGVAASGASLSRAPAEGGDLEYEVRGEGEVVLLIHGSLIEDALEPLMSEPALSGYRLVRYHRRGYAGSAPLDGPFSVERQAADGRAVLDHLGVERAHLVGHSYGAVVALQLALERPEAVRSVVLLESPLMHLLPGAGEEPSPLLPAIEAFQAGDTVAAAESFARFVGGPDWRARVERTVPDGPEQALRSGAVFFEVELPALVEWSFDPDRAAAFDPPILFVRGRDSSPAYAPIGEFLEASFPNVETLALEGFDHLLQMQDPERIARIVADFLAPEGR